MYKQLYIYVESCAEIHIKKIKNESFISGHYDVIINCIKQLGVLNDRGTLFKKKNKTLDSNDQ